ncbi:DegT/DnrJ/EryC1/StrS family aminotransferase [Xenorhabdus nematophila]|uniref:DegT/DnrJ/EryC1/StrS family aminotransferase n=1 Tax=Xenorhabdus nematophila TaxID=628 RepID=UPI000691E06F|nr:DegT/DnrJ/EryC1/StrS family aminotransferase [Xenorhabdus nematophila]
MGETISIAKEFNLKIVEDAAHAFPTIYNGKIGTLDTDVTIFSFYANRQKIKSSLNILILIKLTLKSSCLLKLSFI